MWGFLSPGIIVVMEQKLAVGGGDPLQTSVEASVLLLSTGVSGIGIF